MSIGKLKLRKTDRLFTQIVRRVFDYTCQRCGRKYIPGVHNLQNLGVSHYWGRSRENTRYDLDNVTLLCSLPCHRQWGGENRAEYTEYMIARLGQEGFDRLMLKANLYCKRDDYSTELVLKDMMEKLNDTRP